MQYIDLHTHTPLCFHAEGWPTELALAAKKSNCSGIGFSDHSPMPQFFDSWRMLIDDLPRYLDEVEIARAEHPGFPIFLGLEVDFMPGQERWIEKIARMAPWDYLIGSVHYIQSDWAIDDPAYVGSSRWAGSGTEEIWDLYFTHYEACIRSGLFDFCAHPDLPKKFGHRPSGDLRRYYEPIAQAAADMQISLEINTAGLRNPASEIYPSADFLTAMHQAGVSTLINSDAHRPEHVAYAFDQAHALAQQVGYRELATYVRRERKMVPLANVRADQE
jgi:histidinol-phosphatase (PHP family)